MIANLITKVCESIAGRLKARYIRRDNGEPYLDRYYLFRFPKLASGYLHNIRSSDWSQDLHNHPWEFSISLILTGGYHEERRVNGQIHSRILRPGSFNIIRGTDFHRVDLLKDHAWTLFFTGPRAQNWGFQDRGTSKFWWWDQPPTTPEKAVQEAPKVAEGDVEDLRKQIDLAQVDPNYSAAVHYEINTPMRGVT